VELNQMARKKRQPVAKTNTTILDKKQLGISLSGNAVDNLNIMVEKTGIPKSQLIERLITGEMGLFSSSATQTITLETNNFTEKAQNIEVQSDKISSLPDRSVTKNSVTEVTNDDEGNHAIEQLESQLATQKANYQNLAENSSQEIKKLELQLQEQQEKMARSERDRAKKDDRDNSLTEKIKEQETVIANLENQITNYHQQEQALQEKLDTTTQENNQIKQELETANQQCQELQKVVTNVEQQSTALQNQLQQQITDNEALQKEITNYKTQVETQIETVEKERNNLEQQLSTQQQKAEGLQQQLSAAITEQQSLERQITTQKTEFANLQQTLSKTTNTIQSFEAQLATKNSEIEQMKLQVNRFKFKN
jgi:chromosome segregation ATPase